MANKTDGTGLSSLHRGLVMAAEPRFVHPHPRLPGVGSPLIVSLLAGQSPWTYRLTQASAAALTNAARRQVGNWLLLLSTDDMRAVRAVVDHLHAAKLTGLYRLAVFTFHTYERVKGQTFCVRSGVPVQACMNDYNVDSILVYNRQAAALFPRVVSKLKWVPVNWGGSAGTQVMQRQSDMRRSWADPDPLAVNGRNRTCNYFVTTGYASRDWQGLFDALNRINATSHRRVPALQIIGAQSCSHGSLPQAQKSRCQHAYSRCRAMGHRRCHVHTEKLPQHDYQALIMNACFVALPILQTPSIEMGQGGLKLGAGLTGAAEAATLGKIVIVTSDRLWQERLNASQWSGYVEDNATGVVLPDNSATSWQAVLDSYLRSEDATRWDRLQAGAWNLALERFSLEAIHRTLGCSAVEKATNTGSTGDETQWTCESTQTKRQPARPRLG